MAITAEEQTFFNNAINTVFSYDKDDLRLAQKMLTQYSNNIPELLTKLDKLCGCSFSTKAGLENSPPPQAVADSISAAVTAAGGETPSDIYLKKKVGNTDLTTTNKDLSKAVNELDASGGTYTPIGTLGSSYSCTSTSDTSPTLIATGSTSLAEMFQQAQKCIIWAAFNHDGSCRGERIYISYSSDGGCFEAQSCDDGAGAAYAYCMYGLDH